MMLLKKGFLMLLVISVTKSQQVLNQLLKIPLAAEDGVSDEEYAAEESLISAMENAPSKSGTPKQQAWRSCVAESKGNMEKAKEIYASMGY